MATTTESVHVAAPREAVFEYMDRPENQPEITPSLTRSETLERLENGGKRVAYEYEMAGISIEGEVTAVDWVENERIAWRIDGDLEGELEWRFEDEDEDGDDDEDDGTRVTYSAEYSIPVPVLDAVVAPFVRRYNERELRTTLENLRTRLEADTRDREGERERERERKG